MGILAHFDGWYWNGRTQTMMDPKNAAAPLLLAALTLFSTCPPNAGADGADAPEIFVSGTFDLLMSAADTEALEANQMRRGDSPLSHVRLSLFGDVVLSDRLTLFNQLPIDLSARATLGTYLRSYIRYRLFETEGADLHVEAGKIPTPFGHFTERAYTDKNPLLGHALMYHYASTLRSNQLPASNADLLRHRGEGRFSSFGGYEGGGARSPNSGLPLVYDSCWDFGGSLVGSVWRFEYLIAVTSGTLSDPRPSGVDNNDGRQLALRLGFVPFTGLLLRGSFARGPYLDRAVGDTLAVSGHDVALRYGGLRFDDIDDGGGAGRSLPWDYDVGRLEFGFRYRPTEHLITKLTTQLNDFGRPGDVGEHLVATQLTVLF